MTEADPGGDRVRDEMGSAVEVPAPNRKTETHPWRPADADATWRQMGRSQNTLLDFQRILSYLTN